MSGASTPPTGWTVGARDGGPGFPLLAPFNDGLPGMAQLATFAYRPHAELAAAAPDMLRVLEQVEWVDMPAGNGWRSFSACPCCERPEDRGHDADCDLAAALKRARGEC